MKILKGIEIPITICVCYTILSVSNAVLNLLNGISTGSHENSIIMLLWTSIAVFILSIHHLFDEFSPLVMIILQYIIAMGLVFLSIFIIGFFSEVNADGYKDAFISFTIPYIIGGGFYYISLFRSVVRQNKLLTEIQKNAAKN